MTLTYIHWNPDEKLIDFGFFAIRYYSICFMLAFVASYLVMRRQFDKYHFNMALLDKLSTYVFLGTIIGAKLGHCFFYYLEYFL